jgi:hypothetical protein
MRPNITFIKGQGASKRVGAGQDFISGLVFYTGSLPSGFTTANNIKALYSPIDAINAGILNDFSDATAASGSYLVTTAGTTGDVINITVADLDVYGNKQTTTIGTYTKVSGDSTAAAVATSIASAINALTTTTGYSATVSSATVTIIAPKRMGIFLNSGTPIVVTLSSGATLAGTLTQFSGGVASKQAVWYYHINRFFGANPNSILYVGFFPVPSTYTFSEITLLQTFSGGTIRQVGVYKDSAAYAVGDLVAIDNQIKTYNDAKHKPLSALYAADLSGTSDITTIVDLSTYTANKCSSIIGQDGYGLGNYLYLTYGKSITQLGVAMGLLSLSAVSEDFGEPAKFNLAFDGYEDAVPAFANGKKLSDPSLSDAALDALDAKRHIFGLTYIGYAGTFFNDNHTAISTTSDYAFINDNRVIDKATRGVYSALIPYLKSNLVKNAYGTLAATTVAFLQGIAIQPLYQMSRDGDLGEISASDVYIDPSQNVSSTNMIVINVYLNEDAIARQIQIPISFK